MPKQRQQAIAQRRERVSRGSGRGMPGILTKCHIPHVMDLILDRPMAAPQPLDLSCSRLLRRHTHQSIALLRAAFATLEHDPFTFFERE
jgi:hypothetical protein